MPESEAPYTFPEDESLAIKTLITQNLETSLETLNPEDAGALTGDETVFIKVGGALRRTTAQAIAALGGGGDPGYLEYIATLSQSGMAAPVATVLKNTLGGTPTFARTSPGSYAMTLTGAWTSGKTVILPGTIPAGITGGTVALVEIVRESANVIRIRTGDAFASSLLDDLLGSAANGLSVHIMVFP